MALKFRRGTTAQQSGSLAFGEPFVNTTLGTLLVGGATGDITLAVAGTGSTGTFGAISGSGLDITGNANIAGNLTLGGNITIGDAGTDTIAINADLSSSLIPNNDNAFTIGTDSLRYSNIYGVNIIGSISANNGVVSGSSQIVYANISSIPGGIISGSSQLSGTTIPNLSGSFTGSYTGSFTGSFRGNLAGVADYASTVAVSSVGTTTDTTLYPTFTTNAIIGSYSSLYSHLSASFFYNGVTRQVNAEGFVGGIYANNGVVSGSSQVTLQSTTGFSAYDTALSVVTGSLISSASNHEQRLSANEAVSGTFARTNSTNTFNGNQTVSGSLTVTQDLIVLGSSSIQNVSSSTLNIGTNLITVATNQPSVRFGGLAVIDSGSSGASGSFLYDSVEDEFIFLHRGDGTNITSSHFVLGPETYNNLGNETYLTNNRVPKGTGKEHLNDSNITDTGTLITLGSNSVVNGTFYATSTTLVSGSSQVDLTATTNYASGILTRLNAVGVVSGSSQITAGSTTNFATDVKTQLNSNTVVSGSSQVDLTATTNYASGILTRLNAVGVFSGSSQVSLGSASGNIALATQTTGDYVASLVAGTGVTLSNNSGENATPTIAIGQSVATNATPTFGNLTINGTITATGDITAFFTSDRRHKNSIQTISNAVLKVKQLNGVTWEWNDDVNEVTKSTPKTGLIAQEVQQVLPQVVTERNDGFLALDYSKMVGLLVEAIKEQQIQIDQLKAQIGSK